MRCGLWLNHIIAQAYSFSSAVVHAIFTWSWPYPGQLSWCSLGNYSFISFFWFASIFRECFLFSSSISFDHEGEIDRCRGVINNSFIDLNVFRQFCNGYFIVMFPVLLLVISTYITWLYLLSSSYVKQNPKAMVTQSHLHYVTCSDISISFILYILSLGGLDVTMTILAKTSTKLY